jgi:hypothetical protein
LLVAFDIVAFVFLATWLSCAAHAWEEGGWFFFLFLFPAAVASLSGIGTGLPADYAVPAVASAVPPPVDAVVPAAVALPLGAVAAHSFSRARVAAAEAGRLRRERPPGDKALALVRLNVEHWRGVTVHGLVMAVCSALMSALLALGVGK